jgi:hypothetical protein
MAEPAIQVDGKLMTLKELEKKIALLEQLQQDNLIFEFHEGGLWYPNPPQQRLLEAWHDPSYKTFTFTGSNQKGKTTLGVILAICTASGEYLWSGEKMRFPHKEPRMVMYVGHGWETHIKVTVEPEFEKLWPKTRPVETRKNNQGVKSVWKDKKTRSEIHSMSNTQESTTFEGGKWDLIVWDEPPQRENRVAAARGLMRGRGRELFVATLISEAWLHREVIKARLPNGEPDTSVFNVEGDIWDNVSRCKCGSFILRENLVHGEFVGFCEKCGNVRDYVRYGLTLEGVDDYKRKLKKDEIASRIEGKPSYLTTLVLPNFNRDINTRTRFNIPLDALVDINIDFHPSKPYAIQFMATCKNGIKFICEEIEEHGNPKYMAELIIRRIKDKMYRVNNPIQIDPLAKGDENNDQTVFQIMQDTFAPYGYSLDVASKDKDNGIAILNSLLMTENEMPALYIFKDCVKTIQQLEDWMTDPVTLKPSKVEDDFCEVTYRNCLKNTQWYEELKVENTGKSVVL